MPTSLDGPADLAASTRRSAPVAARRVTLVATVLLMAGVLAQAVLAGGLLAGRGAIGEFHRPIGHIMTLVGFVPLVAGLIGRRWVRESGRVLLLRIGVAIVVLTVMLVGNTAAGGTRDLLMLHIPLAFLVMGLSAQLFEAARSQRR